jgi:hypothetical protein
MKPDLAASEIHLESKYEYHKKMGAYKPDFQGIPEDYYPLTNCEVLMYSIFVITVILTTLGIMIGFLEWIIHASLNVYTIIWGIIFLVFVIVMMILFYIFGRKRIT